MNEVADKPRTNYRVNIPGIVDMFMAAYSDRQALTQALFSAMKAKGGLWYLDTEYMHEQGARNLAARILEDPNWQRYVQMVGPEGKPLEVDLTPEKKPKQLELDIDAAILETWTDNEAYQVLNSGKYATDEWYELSVTWPVTGKKITYTADNEEQYQHLVEIGKKGHDQEAPATLRIHQRQRRTLKWEKYKEFAKPLVERMKADASVQALLKKYNKDASFLDNDLDVIVSPYLKEGVGRFDPPKTLRVGFSPSEPSMDAAFIHYLSAALQYMASPEQTQKDKVWRVLDRPFEQEQIANTVEVFKGQGKGDDEIAQWLVNRYGPQGMTEENAREILRTSAAIVEDAKIARQISDGILWRKGKVSIKAIEQFRRYATPELQATADGLLLSHLLEDAIDVVRPYMAFQVQSAGEGAQAKVIAVDFDGVLAQHDPSNNTMEQAPIDGAIEALNQLVDDGYQVTIFSCRANKQEGADSIKDWLQRFGGPDLPVTGDKPSADAYIDDKAIKFTSWSDALEKVKNQKKLSSLICEHDGTVMGWALGKQAYVCPACDSLKTLADASALTIYAFSPGDKVHVKSVEGTTLGDAHVLYRASPIEERALKASNLWIVKFVTGEYLPVAESFFVKTGFDDEKRLEAESVIMGDDLIEPEEDTTLKYDLDKVIEATLQEVQEAKLPADAILVGMASHYCLTPEDLDTLAEHVAELDKVEEVAPTTQVDLVAVTADALEEADAFFEDAKQVPSEEDEQTLVIGYLAEEFGWTEELVDHAMENKMREVIAIVRQASKTTPRWITAKDQELWDKSKKLAGEGGIVPTITIFRTLKQADEGLCWSCGARGGVEVYTDAQGRQFDLCSKCYPKDKTADVHDYYDEEDMKPKPAPEKKADNQIMQKCECGKTFYDSPEGDGKCPDCQGKTAEVKEYMPTDMPSLTSIPEGEYDVVRQQTVAAEHKHSCPYCDTQWSCGNDPAKCTINPSWPCTNCLKAKDSKTATLKQVLEGVRLDAESKRIVASIFEDIMLYEDKFLTQAGQFFTYEWDPGASWEVREVEGKKQIVRKQPVKKETKKSNHVFQEGQVVKYHAAFFPADVRIVSLLGDNRYSVKSTIDGSVHNVSEDDLFLPESDNVFQ